MSKTLDALLSPLTWSLALITIGLSGKAAWRRRWIAVAGLAVLLLFSFEPIANGLEQRLERQATRTYRDEVTYDAVILLGGMVDRTAVPGQPAYNDNIERLLVTYDLLRKGRARHVIVSGGRVDPLVANPVEADVLARQLVEWGISADRIAIEPHARNTHENAVESQRIAAEHGWTRLLVVTSAYHMPRALDCFHASGLAVDSLPVDYRAYDTERYSGSWLPRSAFLARSTAALRELFGNRIYQLKGYAR
ncbi:MAG: YdcF family protein [Myxococcota bacterium]|nr:YdcF family protein [Myxococcota bacterium]